MTKMAVMPNMVKTINSLLLRNQKAEDTEIWFVASDARVLPSCSNDDPELTLTYITARSNLVSYAFAWEKGKTMDFSETILDKKETHTVKLTTFVSERPQVL